MERLSYLNTNTNFHTDLENPIILKGIAFLMPRKSALIADEMGLGKTIQVIISIRLLFRSGLLKNVLIVLINPLKIILNQNF